MNFVLKDILFNFIYYEPYLFIIVISNKSLIYIKNNSVNK